MYQKWPEGKKEIYTNSTRTPQPSSRDKTQT